MNDRNFFGTEHVDHRIVIRCQWTRAAKLQSQLQKLLIVLEDGIPFYSSCTLTQILHILNWIRLLTEYDVELLLTQHPGFAISVTERNYANCLQLLCGLAQLRQRCRLLSNSSPFE